MAKVRVYELAKEFGVESKAVMAKLEEMGEFVRSASSTIEAPVVRRLKEAFNGGGGKSGGAASASGGQVRREQGGGSSGPRPGGDRPARVPDSVGQNGAPAPSMPASQGPRPGAASRTAASAAGSWRARIECPCRTRGGGGISRARRSGGTRASRGGRGASGRRRRSGPAPGGASPGNVASRRAGRADGPQGTAPGGAATSAPRPGAPRPTAPGPRPAAPGQRGPRPAGPRPGNNPFSSTATGMGSAPAPRPGVDRDRPERTDRPDRAPTVATGPTAATVARVPLVTVASATVARVPLAVAASAIVARVPLVTASFGDRGPRPGGGGGFGDRGPRPGGYGDRPAAADGGARPGGPRPGGPAGPGGPRPGGPRPSPMNMPSRPVGPAAVPAAGVPVVPVAPVVQAAVVLVPVAVAVAASAARVPVAAVAVRPAQALARVPAAVAASAARVPAALPAGGPGGGTGGPPRPGGGGGRGRPGGGGTAGAFGRPGGKPGRARKSKRQRRQEFDNMQAPTIGGVQVPRGQGQVIRLSRGASLSDFADKIGANPASLVQVLFHLGEMVTATQSVNDETLQLLGAELNYNVQVVSPEEEDRELLEQFSIDFGDDEGGEEDLVARPPVVTVMGHVDHGKTKLLDAIRHTNVVSKEAGGITQHIGAYQVAAVVDGDERKITFIDTPGHEAFTAMRARGAQTTDLAVLVVAADDGVKPQTTEALNHAQAAGVPIVVAVNKIDKEGADPSRVRAQLTEYGLIAEEFGGDTQFVDVSATKGIGLDKLLEAIILTADASLDLRANPNQDAQGVAIEAQLDKGRGPVATVLVQRGTLHVGDSIVAGEAYGRVRAMLDEDGNAARRRRRRRVRCRCSASPRCRRRATTSLSSPTTGWPGRSPSAARRASALPSSRSAAAG